MYSPDLSSACEYHKNNMKQYIRNWFKQLLVSCGDGRWPVDGLRQHPCSHQPTASVGHSTGCCQHFDFITMDKAKTIRTSTTARCMMEYNCVKDEHLISRDKLQHHNHNSRDQYYNGLGFIQQITGMKRGERGQRGGPGGSPAWRRSLPPFQLRQGGRDRNTRAILTQWRAWRTLEERLLWSGARPGPQFQRTST